MPVLDTERAFPRSALRYRPGAETDQVQSRPGPPIARKSRFRADVRSTTARAWPDDLDLAEEENQPSQRRPTIPAPRQRTALAPRARWRFHPFVFLGLALFIMLLGWFAISAIGTWWQITQDDWHYGRPRTFQIDQVVGHHDSAHNPSHFIAMNLNRHVVIIEIPGGDVTHAVVYSGPVLLGPGQDLTPVTLSFEDVNHDGEPNMVVHVSGSQLVFVNANGTFAAPPQNGTG